MRGGRHPGGDEDHPTYQSQTFRSSLDGYVGYPTERSLVCLEASDLESSFCVSPDAPAQARQVIDKFDPTLSSRVQESLRLVVSELISNAVQHGLGGEQRRIRLRVETSVDSIMVEVFDEGRGFSPPTDLSPGTNDHGWGLAIVEGLASAWGVGEGQEAGTRVWAEIPVNGSPTSPSS
jgi:two-component sensor histidine kinase